MKGYLRPFQRIVRLYRDSNLRRDVEEKKNVDRNCDSGLWKGEGVEIESCVEYINECFNVHCSPTRTWWPFVFMLYPIQTWVNIPVKGVMSIEGHLKAS